VSAQQRARAPTKALLVRTGGRVPNAGIVGEFIGVERGTQSWPTAMITDHALEIAKSVADGCGERMPSASSYFQAASSLTKDAPPSIARAGHD
jgi:hypothetical protein